MARQTPTNDNLTRRSWVLWGSTFAVLLALTASIPLLYVPLLQSVERGDGDAASLTQPYYALVGLLGLVLLFCLYTVLKQRELNQMRSALLNEARESEVTRTRLSELLTLFQMSTSLNLQLRLEVILEIIVRRVVSSLKAQQASIMVYNPETGELETRATYGLESEFARNAKKKLGEGIAGWVAQRQQSVMLAKGSHHPELGQHFKSDRNITSALSLPLRVGERCIGVLNVNRINHPEMFQEHHREMLTLFAEHVGAVIDRAQAMERMGSRSRQLEQDVMKLTEMNHMKDTFLSTASHELKTPLTSVIAYAELLDENASQLDPGQRAEFLRRLRGEAERLLGLIDDILDVTRLESGKLTLKRAKIALTEVAAAAIETSRSMAAKRGIEIDGQLGADLPIVPIDEVKMRQVIVNLLVNAIKFSPAKSRVTVRATREPKFLLLEVSDKGPGIAPEDATHIFELFGQAAKSEEQRDLGVGIGLHLVKRITELHGGHVGLNSRVGEGSTFWVRLPLALADAEPGEAERLAA